MDHPNPRGPLLEVRDLRVEYATSSGPDEAVSGVTLTLAQG
jgi:ABC-type glutathione transport system ATPase component